MPVTGLPNYQAREFECSNNGNFSLLPSVILQMTTMAVGITSQVDLLRYSMGRLFHNNSDEAL